MTKKKIPEVQKEDSGKVRDEKDKAQNYLDIAGTIIVAINADQTVSLINKAGCQILGYSEDEIIGKNWFDNFLPENVRDEVRSVFNNIATSQDIETTGYFENYILAKDGKIKLIAWSNNILRDSSNNFIGTLSSGMNITERMRMEEQIKWNTQINESLAELYKPLTSALSMKEIADTILTQAQKLTGSKHGYVSSIDPVTGDNVGHTLTDMMGDACHVDDENKRTVFPKGSDGHYRGLFGHSLNTGESFFTNSPTTHPSSSGVPEGHIPLERFLSVPVILDEKLVGQIALANSNGDYTDKDLNAIKRLAEYYALAIQRMRMEERLVKNEARYRNIIAQAGGVAYQRDWQNGTYIFMDEGIKHLTGYSSDEITPELFERLVDEENPDGVNKKFIRSEISQQIGGDAATLYQGEYCIKTKDSQIKFVSDSSIEFHNTNSEIVQTLGMLQDITQRKKAERALIESEERYRSLFEDVPIGLYRTTPSGQILDANKAEIDLLGYPDKNTFLAINSKDTYVDPDIRDKMLSEANSKSSLDTEIQLRRYDGTHIWVRNISKAIKDEKGNILYYDGMLEDITDRKQAEILQEKLQQASKMESIGRLAGGVAHDFNNLLTVIQGSASLSLRELSKNDPIHDRLKMILEASERAADLTRQLLAFSRKQIIDMKVINLNNLITNLRKMLVRLIGEDVELKTILARGLDNINADVGQIEQIIVNLSVNARDAMPEGGKLTIETANVELGEAYCKIHLNAQPGKYVMLIVSDKGSGMDNATKEHIFEPFFTTKGVGEGTGLGLATVYGIVKQHNGSIEFYSELGHGTTFKIYLPIAEGEVSIQPKESKKIEMPIGNETILVVEDEDIVREMVVEFLTGLGYNVLPAENGGMALMIAEQHKGRIQLMLTDVVMPNMNGHQLAERLKREHPEMKILYTSGYTENIIVHHGILNSGLNFIGKPYMLQSLAKKLRDLLDA